MPDRSPAPETAISLEGGTAPFVGMRRRGEKVAEAVARDIVRQIASRQAPLGTILPGEAEMLRVYGISRATLREALRILEVHGIITIKPGPRGGPRVAGAGSADLGRMSTLHFQLAGATFAELQEARTVLESMMAGLAAARRPAEAMQRLEATIATDQDIFEADDESYVRSSSEFHSLVAGMSGNKVLDLVARSIRDIYADRVKTTEFSAGERQEILDDHAEIAQAILRGDAEAAESLMREHLLQHCGYVAASHPGMMNEVVDWR